MISWRPFLAFLLTVALVSCTTTPKDPREMTLKEYRKSLGRDVDTPYVDDQYLIDATNWQAAGGYKEDPPYKPKGSWGRGPSMSEALNFAITGLQLAHTIKGTQSSSASRSSYASPALVTPPRQSQFGTQPSRTSASRLPAASSRSTPWATTSPLSRTSGIPTPLTWNSSPLRIVDSYPMGNGLIGITVANTSGARVSARIWRQDERPEHAGSYTLSPGERITADATFKYLKRGQSFMFSQQ